MLGKSARAILVTGATGVKPVSILFPCVAAAIERLSADPEGAGETIHLVADHPPTQKQVMETFRSATVERRAAGACKR